MTCLGAGREAAAFSGFAAAGSPAEPRWQKMIVRAATITGASGST